MHSRNYQAREMVVCPYVLWKLSGKRDGGLSSCTLEIIRQERWWSVLMYSKNYQVKEMVVCPYTL